MVNSPQIVFIDELDIPKADFFYSEDLFDNPQELYDKLLEEIPWQQEDSYMMGKVFKQPRKTCLVGDSDKTYFYSGFERKPFPITPTISYLMKEAQEMVELVYPGHPKYTSVLCNLYEDGNNYIARHSDDETDLEDNCIISSYSFGAERFFDIHSKKKGSEKEKLVKRLTLKNGSWVGMGKGSQKNYKHSVPKQLRVKNGRINLTFRVIKQST